jgi:hypothetical protein
MHYNKIVNEDEKKRFRESEKFYVVIYMSFENADDSYSRNRPPEWWLEEEKEPNFSEDGKWLGTWQYSHDDIISEYLFNNETEAQLFIDERLLAERESERDGAVDAIENIKREIEELKKKLAEESKE